MTSRRALVVAVVSLLLLLLVVATREQIDRDLIREVTGTVVSAHCKNTKSNSRLVLEIRDSSGTVLPLRISVLEWPKCNLALVKEVSGRTASVHVLDDLSVGLTVEGRVIVDTERYVSDLENETSLILTFSLFTIAFGGAALYYRARERRDSWS